jgi:hypothetical protein
VTLTKKHPDAANLSPLWNSLRDLFSCSWFWRLWVVQECVLASSAIVKWGHAEIDWRWVGLASAILRTNYHKICEKMKIGGVYNAYLMFRMSPMSDLPPLQISFVQLLRLTRQFEITEKLDRVYGLLGIKTTDNDSTEDRLFIEPDYSISNSQLWKRLTRKVIHDSQIYLCFQAFSMYMSCWPTCSSCGNLLSFPLLKTFWDMKKRLGFCTLTCKLFRYSTGAFEGQGVGQYGERLPDEDLPSWVPHWEIVYRATLAPWDVDDRFSAAKGFSLRLRGGNNPNSLIVEGIIAGVVGYGLNYMWHDLDISSLKLQAVGAFLKTEPGLRLLARTLTAGKNWYGSLVDHSDEALPDFSAYLLELSKRKPQERKTNTFDQNYYLSNHSPE